MKKKLSKITIIVLALIMLVTVVAGCTKETSETTPKKTEKKAEEKATEAPKEELAPADEGVTFPLVETFTFELMMSESNQVPMVTDSTSIKAIKSLLNIELNLLPVPESDYATKLSTALALTQ